MTIYSIYTRKQDLINLRCLEMEMTPIDGDKQIEETQTVNIEMKNKYTEIFS